MIRTKSNLRATPSVSKPPQAPAKARPARPFLKWAGGKGQLLARLEPCFPKALRDGSVHTYVEPFLGGGAMFFHVMQNYPIRDAYLLDANEELVLVYKTVQQDVDALIARLEEMAAGFLRLSQESRKERYLKVRAAFNRERARTDFKKYAREPWVERAAQILFLNKTCYNGLFRVNRSGGFNTPFGKYLRPSIVDAANLRAASALLGRGRVRIRLGDFGDLAARGSSFIKSGAFVYYDPPYHPISRTSNFTSYSKGEFGEEEQRRLAAMFRSLDAPGVFQMLSNSDPKNVDPKDDFFEDLYSAYRGTIFRVPASRSINSDPSRRGKINEIVITNYGPDMMRQAVEKRSLSLGRTPLS